MISIPLIQKSITQIAFSQKQPFSPLQTPRDGQISGRFRQMGGYGSGGCNRTGRLTTSDALRLDVNSLNKSGALVLGSYSITTWTRDGETTGNINISASQYGIVLVNRSKTEDRGWADHSERVSISWERGGFGGQRPFFHCPDCARRVLHLYGFSRYLCRHCHGLCYPSQREGDSDRAQRRANRIRVELGGEPRW
jgi:hypothetical protein